LADGIPKPRAGAVVFVPEKVVQEQPPNTLAALATVAQVMATIVTLIVVARR
jgi:hypothetical protein